MQKVGEEVMLLTYNSSSGYFKRLGTPLGENFLAKRTDIAAQFSAHVASKLVHNSICMTGKLSKLFQ